MPLGTEITTLQAVMSGVCACTAAAMHWAAVTAADKRLPRPVLAANMLASAVGGLLTAQALDLVPWATIPPLLGVGAAAIVGHTLGPRALWWFGNGALGALEKHTPWFKAEPLPDPTQKEGESDGSDQHPVPLSGEVSYLLVSGLRVATAFAALLAVRAMIRYTRAAVPPPHAPSNLLYWARYWWEVHWRESPALKAGGLMVASSLISQVQIGPTGLLADLTPYRLYVLLGMFLVFTGFAQFPQALTLKLERQDRASGRVFD